MILGRAYIVLWTTLFMVLLMPLSTNAISDSFTIKQVISGNDITPPTTPTISSVTPVSSSQIDVVWGAVTDNVAVGGYQVFRDMVQVATTTLLSFSDTGLTPSTTYAYAVRAFDTSNNLSATSTGVSTTTLGLINNNPPTHPSSGGRVVFDPIELVSLKIETDEHKAKMRWHTNRYARYLLRWGRTTNYELGYVQSESLALEHGTIISELDAGTVYAYELIAYDKFDKAYVLSRDQFTTESGPDTAAPTNVSNLQATLKDSGVLLSWKNPQDSDFSHVRVVRSHYFYPTHPAEGFLVYNGSNTEVFDSSPFMFGEREFYSVFSYDTSGNRSSGAVVMVVRKVDNDLEIKEEKDFEDDLSIDPSLSGITFSDFQFIQDGIVLNNDVDTEIHVDGSKPLTVAVPYEIFPQHLKSIVVMLTHPDDANLVFSFLLRVNKDSTAYEAKIAPFYEEGLFSVRIAVFDYIGQEIKEMSGFLLVSYDATKTSTSRPDVLRPETLFVFFLAALLLLISIFLYLLAWKRDRDKES